MSSRKSTRLLAKAEAATQLLQNDKHLGNTTIKNPRNSKKQRTSKEKDASNAGQPRRRIKGKEENSKLLKDVPLDVLLEIFRLLEPVDLLHFSRVSKSLHDLLTSNDLSSLWKSVYMNVDPSYRPPLCPDDTNVVFYTNYVYGRHCQFCSSGQSRMIHHDSAFIRLCSKCADDHLLELTGDIKELCHSWELPQYKNRGEMILKVEYSLRLEEIKHARNKKVEFRYIKERNHVLRNRLSVAYRISDWRKKMQRIQLDKLRVNRQLREADILKKLEQEEGYNQDDILAIKYRVQHAPHARKSHKLTDSEWRLIRTDVLDFLQDVRDNWLIRKIESRLQSRISQLEWFISRWKFRPTAWWLTSSSEPIASFIQIGSLDKTYSTSSADFEKIEPQIRDLITSWREETDCYLATLIPQPSGKGKKKDLINSNSLELATTFFKCYWCTEPISHPRILVHGCFHKTVKSKDEAKDEKGEEDDMEDLERDTYIDAHEPREPRPPKEITPELILPTLSDYHSLGMRPGEEGVTYDEEASNTARDIITACGEDPKTVTSAAMEEKPVRLECLRCSRVMQAKQRSKSNRLVMKWNMAIVHELEEHYDEPPSSEPAWRKVDPPDLEKVENAETNMKNLQKYQKLLSCNRCRALNILPIYRVQHIANTHRIIVNKATVSDHFSPPVDTSVKMLYPAVKI